MKGPFLGIAMVMGGCIVAALFPVSCASTTAPGKSATFTTSPTDMPTGSETITGTQSPSYTQSLTPTQSLTNSPSITSTVAPTTTGTQTPCVNLTGTAVTGSSNNATYCVYLGPRWGGISIQATVTSEDWNLTGHLDCGSSTTFGSSSAAAGMTDYAIWDGSQGISCGKGEAVLSSGSSGYTVFPWSNNFNILTLTGGTTIYSMGDWIPFLVFQTTLTAGTPYSFSLTAAAAMMMRLHDPGLGSRLTPAQAVGAASGGYSFGYTPSATSTFALVMTANYAAYGSFTIVRTP